MKKIRKVSNLIIGLFLLCGIPACIDCGDAVNYHYTFKGFEPLVTEEKKLGVWTTKQNAYVQNHDSIRFVIKPITTVKITYSQLKRNNGFSLINTASACSPGVSEFIDTDLKEFKIFSSSDFNNDFKAGESLNAIFTYANESGDQRTIEDIMKSDSIRILIGDGYFYFDRGPKFLSEHQFTFQATFPDTVISFTTEKLTFY